MGFSVRPSRRVEAGPDEARDQQMGRHLAIFGVAKGMRQPFGQALHPGLGDVVGGYRRAAT